MKALKLPVAFYAEICMIAQKFISKHKEHRRGQNIFKLKNKIEDLHFHFQTSYKSCINQDCLALGWAQVSRSKEQNWR